GFRPASSARSASLRSDAATAAAIAALALPDGDAAALGGALCARAAVSAAAHAISATPEARLPRARTDRRCTTSAVASGHLARELLHVEVVAPGADLPGRRDLERAHDRKRDLLPAHLEAVDALGEDDVPRRGEALDLEFAPRAGRQELREGRLDLGAPADRRQRDGVIDGVVGEEAGELLHVAALDRLAERSDDLFRAHESCFYAGPGARASGARGARRPLSRSAGARSGGARSGRRRRRGTRAPAR